MIGRIYLVRNLIDGKGYVGQTVNSISQRWSRHKVSVKAGSVCIFHNAIRKYGIENFLISEVTTCSDFRLLNELESHCIQFFGTHFKNGHGYNMTEGGDGSLGFSHSEETKEKMAIAKLGIKRGPHSSEHRKNLSDAAKRRGWVPSRKGLSHSEDSKLKMSLALKGRLPHNKGTRMSQSQKDKISATKRHTK